MPKSTTSAQEASTHHCTEETLIRRALPLIEIVARNMRRRLGPQVEHDELVSLCFTALVPAVRNFDPARCRFEPYIVQRLKWAILDEARRHARRRAISLRHQTTAHGSHCHTDSNSKNNREPCQVDEMATTTVHSGAGKSLEALADENGDPEQELMKKRSEELVRQAVASLSEKHRALVQGHYFEGRRFDLLAAEVGISRSRAYRLHREAIQTLAKHLRRQARSAFPRRAQRRPIHGKTPASSQCGAPKHKPESDATTTRLSGACTEQGQAIRPEGCSAGPASAPI